MRLLPWLLMLLGCVASVRADEGELVLLFTSDMHSQLAPRRVREPDGSHERGGVARLATLIARERAHSPGRTLLVDAGDFAMGTPFHTGFREQAYELQHLGRLGYDAITLGNHDFDFLAGGLAASLEVARRAGAVPPIVAANTRFPDLRDPGARALQDAFRTLPVTPYRVLTRAGLRIGVFGVLGKDAAGDAPFAKPVLFDDAIEASRRVVASLRTKERVDVVIALSHGGTAAPPAHSEDEELARAVPGIDVIVSGHSHRPLSEPLQVGRTWLVRAGACLANLGVLRLRKRGATLEKVAHTLLAIDEHVPEEPAVAARVASERAQVDASYFARFGRHADDVLAAFDFEPERLDTLPAHPGELALGDLVTDAYAWAVTRVEAGRGPRVDVVLHPLGHLRDSFLAGPVRVADVFSVLSLGLGVDGEVGYPLVSFQVSGAELRDMLEVEATVAPKKRTAHLQVSGVRFAINPLRLPTDRVHDVFVGGQPLDPARSYRVVMNYYVASRLDYMAEASRGLLSATPRDRTGTVIADLASARVDADPHRPGVQELKEWAVLADYLASFPDTNGDGMADVPRRYARPGARFAARPSWGAADLLRSPHGLTRLFLAVWLGLTVLVTVVALRIWQRRRRAGRAKS